LNQEEIAKQLGISGETFRRLKRLQELILELQNLVEDGTMKPTTAILWARLSKEDQSAILNELGTDIVKEMTQNQMQEFINSNNKKKT